MGKSTNFYLYFSKKIKMKTLSSVKECNKEAVGFDPKTQMEMERERAERNLQYKERTVWSNII